MPASTETASNINDKLFEAAAHARSNPYIQKLIEDEALRENAISALKSARKAFERANKKGWDKELAKDKKLRREVEEALAGIREAKAGLVEAPKQAKKRKKRRAARKLVFVALIGGIVAALVNEGFRKKVLDALFGAEEEFQYTSTTTTSSNGSS